ncbi:unnamed protein product [Blumeria hordei]|uniref:Uncharacterized protein n=1 Tax=Blumeria hordei TaxID=2867405 RepID=A0A383UZZ2_BLUHO|nr:unnamed protein product [Blumeria hordei]
MATSFPKKTRFAPGVKSQQSGIFRCEISPRPSRIGRERNWTRDDESPGALGRECKALESYDRLETRWDELYETLVELKRELHNERQRTTRRRQNANMSSVPRPMGQNVGGFQGLQGNYWNSYRPHQENNVYNLTLYGQAGHNYMDPRAFRPSPPLQPPPQYNFPNQYIPQQLNSRFMGIPYPQQQSGWMGVPQYGY